MRTARGHPLAPPSGIVGVGRLNLYDKIGPGPHPCHWCGRIVDWTRGLRPNSLVVDHLDWNSSNDNPDNLVPSCGSCNSRRAAPGRRSAIASDEPSVPIGKTHRTRAVKCTCQTCGKTFLAAKSRPRLYCSRDCYYKSQVGNTRAKKKGQTMTKTENSIYGAQVGEAFKVPKGAPVHDTRTGEWKPAGRAQTVYPYFVDAYKYEGITVTWAGAGGYWRRVRVTEAGEFVARWPGDHTP